MASLRNLFRRAARTCSAALLLTAATLSCPAQTTIKLAADSWMPFNGTPGVQPEGILIDVVKKAFAEAGLSVEYTNMPWARAVDMARKGAIDGVIGATPGDASDFIFPKEVIISSGSTVFTPAASPWKYDGAPSLVGITLGAVLDYSYGDAIDEYIRGHKESGKVQFVGGDTALDQLIQMMDRDRVGGIVESEAVFLWKLREMKLEPAKFKAHAVSPPEPTYIAFSPKNPKAQELATLLDKGVTTLKTNGELAKMLDKYGLK